MNVTRPGISSRRTCSGISRPVIALFGREHTIDVSEEPQFFIETTFEGGIVTPHSHLLPFPWTLISVAYAPPLCRKTAIDFALGPGTSAKARTRMAPPRARHNLSIGNSLT